MEESLRSDKTIFVKSGATIKRIQSSDILYVTCEGNVSELHLQNGRQMTCIRLLKLIEKDLAGAGFVRINHNCLANLSEVEEIRSVNPRKRQLILSNADILDVSYRKWKDVKAALYRGA